MKFAEGSSADGEVACEHDVVGVRDRDAGMEEVRSLPRLPSCRSDQSNILKQRVRPTIEKAGAPL